MSATSTNRSREAKFRTSVGLVSIVMSGVALASMAAASFCGNWAFSITTYSTSVLFAAPHSFIWSPRALSPSGVKLCQPQMVTLLPVDVNFGAGPAAAAGLAAGEAAGDAPAAGDAAGEAP